MKKRPIKLYVQIVKVVGKGTFPIDMLRYDSCRPATELDSGKIARMREERTITLLRYTDEMDSPTTERWMSFGWSVIYYEKGEGR